MCHMSILGTKAPPLQSPRWEPRKGNYGYHFTCECWKEWSWDIVSMNRKGVWEEIY